jgi:inorganic pyrophosphatase
MQKAQSSPMNFPPAFSKEKDRINVVIETPQGSRNKYVWLPDEECFRLKKILPAGTSFPLDFGFVPHTKGPDGDPLDALVIMDSPGAVGVVVECRIIGVLEAEQWKQEKKREKIRNDRLLAVADPSLDCARLQSPDDLSPHFVDEIVHFFEYYNGMSGKEFRLLKIAGAKAAAKLIKSHLESAG